MGKNKSIPVGDRTIILRVLKFLEAEKRKGDFLIPVDQVLRRACVATGVSLSTITRIKREEKKVLQSLPPSEQGAPTAGSDQSSPSSLIGPVVRLPTPVKKKRPAHNKINIDEYTICSLRNIIHSFHTVRREVPTLKKILAVAKAELNFPGQKETLRKVLTEKLGYTCAKKRKKDPVPRNPPPPLPPCVFN